MKDNTMLLVLFDNDTPLGAYSGLTEQQQAQVIMQQREVELSIARQQYGNSPQLLKDHLDRHFFHFHEVRYHKVKRFDSRPTCRCHAYGFPHRLNSGKCEGRTYGGSRYPSGSPHESASDINRDNARAGSRD
jgi:hypothetical protein